MSLKDNTSLKISGVDYEKLKDHLFPGDGLEAAAIALCGEAEDGENRILLVHELVLIPYADCQVRTSDRVTWSTEKLIPVFEKAAKKNFSILKVHCHPTNYPEFSETDDLNDRELFDALFGWNENIDCNISAVMLPDGRMFARTIASDLSFNPVNKIIISGNNLVIWNYEDSPRTAPYEFSKRTLQAFGEGTTKILHSLTVAVIGCSGTGSPTIEQLARLGAKKIIIVDPKPIKEHNVNRILNSTFEDAEKGRYKTDLLKKAIEKIGNGTEVVGFNSNLYDNVEAIRKISVCDIIFGCTDSYDGRHITNLISSFYLIPYIDMGVDFQPDDEGNIDQITGSINYIQPKKSSLRTRSVYNDEKLRAAISFRKNPEDYKERKKMGYLADIGEDSPAVISVNMQISSMAINDFLSRIHNPSFRYESNKKFAQSIMDFSDWRIDTFEEGEVDMFLLKHAGKGNIKPLLNLPELSE